MRLLCWVILATVEGLVSGRTTGNFKQKLNKQAATSDKLFHEALLDQLAASRLSADPQVDATKPMLDDLNVFASTTNSSTTTNDTAQADATTIGLVIYTGNTLPANPTPPAACATALMATIECNSTIPLMGANPHLFNDADLNTVCTSTCASSLASYRANVVTSCAGYSMILDPSTNTTYTPTLAVDYISGPYTVQCLKDRISGGYCTDVIQGYNASGGISSLSRAELCSYCVLATMNATLLNPVMFTSAMEKFYDSTAVTCDIPAFNASVTSPIISPGKSTGVNSTSTTSAQCASLGQNITIKAESTCVEVAAQYSVSLYDVYSSNSLAQSDCSVSAGTTLCLPKACTTYIVSTNDTCADIAAAANITTVQLQLYNPNLGSTCQYLVQLVGSLICVGPHGGFPSVSATTAPIAPSGTATTLAPVPTPTADGSTAACGEWAVAVAGDFCSTFALRYSVTLADLYVMNPEINANCTNLLAGFYYCVEPYPPFSTVTSAIPAASNYTSISTFSYSLPPPTPTVSDETLTPAGVPAPTNVAPGTRTVACGYYYDIQTGDTIASISNISEMAEADLISWNSELATAVPAVGEAICVIFPIGNYTLFPATPPGNVSPFATTDCADYYTAVTNDTCESIAARQDITSAQFLALNPGLTCEGLLAGVAYCDFPLQPPSPATGPPSNLASGSLSNCTTYYTIVSGDTCTSMDAKYDLALVDLLRWNTALTAACTTIQLDEAYCVAGGGDACMNVHTVASGDSCSAIESKFGITLDDILAWNSWLTSSCALQIGQNLCVNGTASTSTGPPANIAAGTLTNCTTYYTVASGDTCTAIDEKYDIALSDLLRWNTALTTACTTIELNEAYCVAGGGDACTQVYTVAPGDSCAAIESKFSVTLNDLLAWNPWLTSSCALQIGQNLCVSGAPSTGSTGPPANIAAGTLANCTTYYTVASGDTCNAIDVKYDISLADLLRWNTALTSACTTIQLNEAYCVAGGGNVCTKIYTVASGDSCSAIETKFGISLNQILAWNPWLTSSCALQIGQNVCVN